MPAAAPRPDLSRAAATSRVAAGQMAVHNLRARTSIVAVEGDLQLDFRDHALAWLGDTVPLTSLALHEGECYVTPQRGVVTISTTDARSAVFAVQPCRAENEWLSSLVQAGRNLARLVKTRPRRAV